jgi:hypothetical protein
MAGADETDNILTSKPTVSQYVAKSNVFSDGSSDHAYHQVCFLLIVFIEPFLQGGILIPFFGKALLKLPVAHAIIPLLSLFTKNSEIKDHLARTVGNGKKQSFETKNTLVMNVGVNSSDVFNAPSGLGIVRIINYQTGSAFLMVCADSYLIPQLNVQVIKKFAPVYLRITHKPIEYIFLAMQNMA